MGVQKNNSHFYPAILLLVASLCGCNDINNRQVNVGYGAWNISDKEVTNVNIGGYYKKKRLTSYPHMTPRMGITVFFNKQVTNIIPEEVKVSWHNTEPVGPYRVKLRSRIPDDVIRKASKTTHTLKIGVSVGKLPILVCWRLERSAYPKPGSYYVQQGGDC